MIGSGLPGEIAADWTRQPTEHSTSSTTYDFQVHDTPLVELSVAGPESGFGHDGPRGPSEAVHDLLAYLSDEIALCPSAHFVIPKWDPIAKRDREKVQPPFVHDPRSLHISRQSNWQTQW